jgi:hypothetical protein
MGLEPEPEPPETGDLGELGWLFNTASVSLFRSCKCSAASSSSLSRLVGSWMISAPRARGPTGVSDECTRFARFELEFVVECVLWAMGGYETSPSMLGCRPTMSMLRRSETRSNDWSRRTGEARGDEGLWYW